MSKRKNNKRKNNKREYNDSKRKIPAAERHAMIAAAGVGGYSVVEFAELFGLCRGAVYALHKDGLIRFAKIGSRSIITPAEAKRFQAALDKTARVQAALDKAARFQASLDDGRAA